MFRKSLIILIIIIFQLNISFLKADEIYKWEKISGEWSVHTVEDSSYLAETRIKPRIKNNDEITNYNSIKTYLPIENYSSIEFSLRTEDCPQSTGEIMIFFALKNNREFYAFRFTADKNNNKVDLISSKIIDPARPRQVKLNYIINNILSEDFNLKSGKKYDFEIKVDGNQVHLLVDGKKIVKAEAPENLSSGHIGFSSRNTMLQVYNMKVFRDKDIIFEDDFTKDSIKRLVVKATLKQVDKE